MHEARQRRVGTKALMASGRILSFVLGGKGSHWERLSKRMTGSKLRHLIRITLAIQAQGEIQMEIHAGESSEILIFPKNYTSFSLFGHLMLATHSQLKLR